MYDQELLCEKLSQVAEALARTARRFANILSADDFFDTEQGQDMLDSICMMLIAVGENFKSIDKHTNGKLLTKYPDVNWQGVKGVRDVISHQYFNIDAEEIFYICSHDLEQLRMTVDKMIKDMRISQ